MRKTSFMRRCGNVNKYRFVGQQEREVHSETQKNIFTTFLRVN